MKKIVLSTLVALSIATVASASDVKLYQDANGQVFTSAADGRTEISTPSTGVSVNSMTKNLDFSMLAYLGYVNTDYRLNTAGTNHKTDMNDFELRRMYFQVKAHLLEDPKSYFRITFDANGGNTDQETAYVKYAFLYLNDILPFTGIEIGQAHTTLLDYEEGHSWAYRSIDNVFTEEHNGPNLYASAGRGFDLKTDTKFFSSELGFYNGEHYSKKQPSDTTTNNNGMGMAFEARLTAHMLGTGTDYKQDHTYLDVSLLGKHNVAATGTRAGTVSAGADVDAIGIHTVFNTKQLLVSAQYWNLPDTVSGNDISASAGTGYSANFDARLGEKDQYHVFGRYDNWKNKMLTSSAEKAQRTYIGGVAYDMNKNIQLQGNVIVMDNEDNTANSYSGNTGKNGNSYMLTAQVQF